MFSSMARGFAYSSPCRRSEPDTTWPARVSASGSDTAGRPRDSRAPAPTRKDMSPVSAATARNSESIMPGSHMIKFLKILTVMMLLAPALAQAWWNPDYKQRTSVILNTSSAGVTVQETFTNVAIPVRLHSGNFDFVGAKADGSDLKVIAGDDKTPLKFWIERFDSVNELAVLWVQVPKVLPGTDKNTVYVYAGNDKAVPDANGPGTPSAIGDPVTIAAFHFSEKAGMPVTQA